MTLLSNKNQTQADGVIQCPTCQQLGVRQNLASVQGDVISIRRLEEDIEKGRHREFTIVKAKDYEIICGRCGEPAFKKNGR